jgi:hypothetical protein
MPLSGKPCLLLTTVACRFNHHPSPGGVAQLVERVLYHSTRRAVPERSWVQSLLPTTEVEPGFSTFGGMLVPVLQLISPVCKTGTSLICRFNHQLHDASLSTHVSRVSGASAIMTSRCRRHRVGVKPMYSETCTFSSSSGLLDLRLSHAPHASVQIIMAPTKREHADKLKAKANQAYAAKHFADAICLYTEAPAEPVYLSNRAAAHFETGDYAASIVDDNAALELLRRHKNVGSEIAGSQTSGEQGDLAKTAEAKRLQLLEKVLKRLRRAAIQKRDWDSYQESSRLLSEVDRALGKSSDILEDKLVADLLRGLCLPEGNVENGTRSVGGEASLSEGVQSAEASGSSVKPVADLSSMPVVRAALSSDFAYFPVGHQDPDGLLGNYEDVQMGKNSGGIAPIDVLQLGGRKNAGGKAQPRDVHLRLLFGACGDPRHVIESFYELESQLTGRPVLPTPPKKIKKKEGESSGSAPNKQWGWVSLTCDMNDFDARVLARNVLFLVMLREAGDQRSQEGGRVLDKMR